MEINKQARIDVVRGHTTQNAHLDAQMNSLTIQEVAKILREVADVLES